MHGRATRNQAKRAAASTGLREYVQHHVAACGQPHVGQARQAAAGAACCQTHQAYGMGATGDAGASVRTGLASGCPGASHARCVCVRSLKQHNDLVYSRS